VRGAGRAAARGRRRRLVGAAAGEGVGRKRGPVHRRGPADGAEAAPQAGRPAGGADRARCRLPDPMRMSLRLRLTVVYGALFMVAGVVLIGVTYLLFERELTRAFEERHGDPEGGNRHRFISIIRDGVLLSPEEMERLLAEQEADLRAAATSSLLAQGVIAVLLVACLATVLGWVLAGRMLAP